MRASQGYFSIPGLISPKSSPVGTLEVGILTDTATTVGGRRLASSSLATIII